jgi:hypothetical protein
MIFDPYAFLSAQRGDDPEAAKAAKLAKPNEEVGVGLAALAGLAEPQPSREEKGRQSGSATLAGLATFAEAAASDCDAGWLVRPDDEIERAERKAIQAEPPLPAPGTPDCDRLDRLNREAAAGYLRAALQRPPSWSGADAIPSQGAFCSCCGGQRWWTEMREPQGWRCGACHPPDHLEADQVRTVNTDVWPAAVTGLSMHRTV